MVPPGTHETEAGHPETTPDPEMIETVAVTVVVDVIATTPVETATVMDTEAAAPEAAVIVTVTTGTEAAVEDEVAAVVEEVAAGAVSVAASTKPLAVV